MLHIPTDPWFVGSLVLLTLMDLSFLTEGSKKNAPLTAFWGLVGCEEKKTVTDNEIILS